MLGEGLPRFGEVVFFVRFQYAPLFRHGQSVYNKQQRLGGDSELTDCGQLYSTQLGEYINELQVTIYCGQLYSSQLGENINEPQVTIYCGQLYSTLLGENINELQVTIYSGQ